VCVRLRVVRAAMRKLRIAGAAARG